MCTNRPFHFLYLTADLIIVVDEDEQLDKTTLLMDLGAEDECGNVPDHDLSRFDSDESSGRDERI